MHYLVCYDVCNDKNRTKLMKYLKNEGFHIQKSVFIIKNSEQQAQHTHDEILKYIDKETDHIFMTPLCQHCIKKMSTSAQLCFSDDVWIV